jgi:hypothetical protein
LTRVTGVYGCLLLRATDDVALWVSGIDARIGM